LLRIIFLYWRYEIVTNLGLQTEINKAKL